MAASTCDISHCPALVQISILSRGGAATAPAPSISQISKNAVTLLRWAADSIAGAEDVAEAAGLILQQLRKEAALMKVCVGVGGGWGGVLRRLTFVILVACSCTDILLPLL